MIVIDDGSTDGTNIMLRTQFPQATVLKGDGNYFWTRATNAGVRKALENCKHDDYILTLNNDLSVPADYLHKMANLAKKFPQSLTGSLSLSSLDQESIIDGGVKINWLTAKYQLLQSGKKYEDILKQQKLWEEVDVLAGRGTLIPVNIFKKIGMYAEKELPHYAADYEFSHRAKNKGFKLIINYETYVINDPLATGLQQGAKKLTWGQWFRGFYSIRSPNCFYYRWNFAKLCCPWYQVPIFFLMDTIRVLFGTFRKQFQK